MEFKTRKITHNHGFEKMVLNKNKLEKIINEVKP